MSLRISLKQGNDLKRRNEALEKQNQELLSQVESSTQRERDLQEELALTKAECARLDANESWLTQKLDQFHFCCAQICRSYRDGGDVDAMVQQLRDLRERWNNSIEVLE